MERLGGNLKSDVAMHLLAEVLWNALLISAPLLAATLLVGLLISVVQVVTQVQEMSLTHIPKIVTAVIVLVAFGPWMLKRLVAFSTDLISNIPSYF
jgi:flagellar biosynthetic protein FliQ